jgi:hypothetical protein
MDPRDDAAAGNHPQQQQPEGGEDVEDTAHKLYAQLIAELYRNLEEGNVSTIRHGILMLRRHSGTAAGMNRRHCATVVVPLLRRILEVYELDRTLTVRCLHLSFLFRSTCPEVFATRSWCHIVVTAMRNHSRVMFVQAICFAWLLWMAADSGGNLRDTLAEQGGIECVLSAVENFRGDRQLLDASRHFLERMRDLDRRGDPQDDDNGGRNMEEDRQQRRVIHAFGGQHTELVVAMIVGRIPGEAPPIPVGAIVAPAAEEMQPNQNEAFMNQDHDI